MRTFELTLSRHLEVHVAESGELVSALDYRPAFDAWGDCTDTVRDSKELMALVDREFKRAKEMSS